MNYEEIKNIYEEVKEKHGNDYFTKIYILSCINDSLQSYEKKVKEKTKKRMFYLVYNSWLDCETCISKISDVIIENWDILKRCEDIEEKAIELINDCELF